MNFSNFLLNDLVWPHSTGSDDRQPLLLFSLGAKQYGFYFLSIPHWIELLAFLIAECLAAALTAVVIYKTVILPRKERTPGPPLDSHSLLVVFGLLIPFWVLAPFYVADYLGFQNKIFRFSMAVISPTLSIFRTIEALFGFHQAHETESLKNFVVSYSAPMLLLTENGKEGKTFIKATWTRVWLHLMYFIGYAFVVGANLSAFLNGLPLFPRLGDLSQRSDDRYSWSNLIDVQQWQRTFLYAVLFQLCLYTFGEGLKFATSLITGICAADFMKNPVFTSRSPSDFWGRRWNLLIHRCLKQGAFKPIRSLGGSTAMAVAAAFFASGLFHEWLLPTVFTDHAITVGPTLIFFLWQAFLVAADQKVGHWSLFQSMTKVLPVWSRAIIVVSLGLPVGHFFTDPYVHSDFFLHLRSFVPCILCLE